MGQVMWSPATDRLVAESVALPIAALPVALPVAVVPAWRVLRDSLKFGDEYYIEPGMASIRPGRARVVALTIDNCDDAPAPYYRATLRYLDSSYPDVHLGGPQLEYHLRRLPWIR